MVTQQGKKRRNWLRLLLLLPFLALIYPPLYNSRDPVVFGIPFFYWYQLAWIIITAIIMAIVYFTEV